MGDGHWTLSDESQLIARARDLVPALAARSDAAVANRTLPPETIDDLREAGFFRAMQPRRFGGLELDFDVFARVTWALAHGCASTAWVHSVVAEMGWVIACFPEQAQVEIWGENPDAISSASFIPAGKARKVAGGYEVSGRWPFVSGSDHTEWMLLTAACADGSGAAPLMNFLVRRHEVTTIDDWFTLGLCATGSRTQTADALFVPEHRAVLYHALLTGRTPGAAVHPQYGLCRAPRQLLTAFSISPVIAGLADRALGLALAGAEKSLASPAGIRDIGALQMKIAESAVENGTVQMIMAGRLEDARRRIHAGEDLGARDVATNKLYASHMVRVAMNVIDRLCTTLGSRWVYQGDPFQLILRDAMTGSTHRAFTWDIAAHAYAASIGLVPRQTG